MKKKIWVIYKITNKINGKIYIGQTLNWKLRRKQHIKGYYGKMNRERRPSIIHSAILSYGEDNFTFEIICRAYTHEEAIQKETFFISYFNSVTPNGYNVRLIDGTGPRVKSTPSMKQQKKNPSHKTCSKYIGVGKRGSVFCCMVRYPRKTLRKMSSEIEAAETYDKIALFVYGPNAIINFEQNRELYLKQDLKTFCENFCRPKEKKIPYLHVTQKRGNVWRVRRPSSLNLFIPCFERAYDAAIMTDKITFFFQLNRRYNFPELIEEFDMNELGAMFETFDFSFRGVIKKRNHWIVKYKGHYYGTYKTREEALEVGRKLFQTLKGSANTNFES